MICPGCKAENSDMLVNCEFCGQPLSAAPGGEAQDGAVERGDEGRGQPTGEYGPSAAPGQGYAPSESPPPTPYSYRQQPAVPGSPWYQKTWVYLLAIVVVTAVVAGIFVSRGNVKSYPALVVDNNPTLLDFYTDT